MTVIKRKGKIVLYGSILRVKGNYSRHFFHVYVKTQHGKLVACSRVYDVMLSRTTG